MIGTAGMLATRSRAGAGAIATVSTEAAGTTWQQAGTFFLSGCGQEGPQQAFGFGGRALRGATAATSANETLKQAAESLLILIIRSLRSARYDFKYRGATRP